MPRTLRPVIDRFWEKVDKSGDCWVWVAGKTQQGYGHLNIGRRTVLASRYSYELIYGSIPEGLQVLHRCDNPPCVRPDHLFLGTQQDNINDMIAKGRQAWVILPWHADELYDADPEEWRRQVLENIAREKAKYAPKVPILKTRISKWPDGTFQLTIWYSNKTVVKSGPFDKRSDAVKARKSAY